MSLPSLSTKDSDHHSEGRVDDTSVVERTWQTIPFPSRDLPDVCVPCTTTRTYNLHVPHNGREGTEGRSIVEIIGEHPVAFGGYSDIWQASLKSDATPTCELVAVKVLRHFGSNASQCAHAKHLQLEVRIWSQLEHESIARFHGVVYHLDGRPAMVSPWYPNGSADVYLRSHPTANPMTLIWQITLGVEYLHDRGVVHGDLKGDNVMVDNTGHAKLIDFGLSRVLEAVVGPSGFTLSTMSFSLRWCAPELLVADNAQATTTTDVYAWASTALQLLTGEVPYGPHRDIIILVTILTKSPLPRAASPVRYSIEDLDMLWVLLEECWAEAQHRPSIHEVKDRLRPFCL